VNYYCRLPAGLAESQVVLLDPMLATGRSAAEAATLLKAQGATNIICLVASKYPDLSRRNRSRAE
jgi:uracil phosphoribosyltransferase